MNDREIKCANCGEIFILRESETVRTCYCPICRKAYKAHKEAECMRAENKKWQIKKEEERKRFEEEIKSRPVVSLDAVEPQPEDRTLYVIGNGFDMMHGAKSSYYDFSKTLGKNSQLRFYLETYLEADDLWADFEGALAKINVGMMCSPQTLELFLEDMGAYDEDAGAAEFFVAAEMATEPITSIARDLKRRFGDWVRGLSTNTDDRPLRAVIKQQGKVLSFNYTEFIEDLYGVKESDICYIHGCRRKKKGFPGEELILGHMPGASDSQYDFEDKYAGIPRRHTQMVYDAQQTALRHVVDADNSLTKDCAKIIKQHQFFLPD